MASGLLKLLPNFSQFSSEICTIELSFRITPAVLPDVAFLPQIVYFLMVMAAKKVLGVWRNFGYFWLGLLAEMVEFMVLKRSPEMLQFSS